MPHFSLRTPARQAECFVTSRNLATRFCSRAPAACISNARWNSFWPPLHRTYRQEAAAEIMLYWLGYELLFHYFSPFRVFQYETFRTAMAAITALLMSIALGPWLIARLREFQIG